MDSRKADVGSSPTTPTQNMNVGRILDDLNYTLDEELFIANHCSIELCELCGDYFAIYHDLYYDGNHNFIELTFTGKFYCQKCK